MKFRYISTTVAVIAALAVTMPVLAQVNVTATGGVTGVVGSSVMASTTGRFRNMTSAERQAAMQTRMQNMLGRGDTAIQNRITALNTLLSRIQSMKNLSSSEVASFSAAIQTSVTDMTNLQAKLQSDTSTTTLQADLKTIAPDYRIYMLVMPQVSILSAVDRVNTLVASFQTIQSKIETRVSGDASLSGNAAISSDLADITAKLADATSQATTAQAGVINLAPDQGNTTVAASNTAALKSARADIQTATKDLATARQDAGAIVKIIISSDKGLMSTSTSQ